MMLLRVIYESFLDVRVSGGKEKREEKLAAKYGLCGVVISGKTKRDMILGPQSERRRCRNKGMVIISLRSP
jgi:hypothetical protein